LRTTGTPGAAGGGGSAGTLLTLEEPAPGERRPGDAWLAVLAFVAAVLAPLILLPLLLDP